VQDFEGRPLDRLCALQGGEHFNHFVIECHAEVNRADLAISLGRFALIVE